MNRIVVAGAFAAIFLAAASPAVAGCNINLRIANTGAGDLQVDLRRSASKVKMGTWADFKGRITGLENSQDVLLISAGDTWAGTLKTDFGCSTKRRFRFAFACGEDDNGGTFRPEVEWEDYFPSDDDYTENRTVSVTKSRCLADY